MQIFCNLVLKLHINTGTLRFVIQWDQLLFWFGFPNLALYKRQRGIRMGPPQL
ncbi:hypothetical protein DV515_00000532 [Chloebia gouldiae]|uniref:Uncharacterized protein n=1 Tax=Chloebia gouldiae TaxID=44316 RepID=A0A3L8T290_CHLGU|nr:hypothetical protein DV515_00000532 [Chloebia gouldiae]